jgi:hypothetical protein
VRRPGCIAAHHTIPEISEAHFPRTNGMKQAQSSVCRNSDGVAVTPGGIAPPLSDDHVCRAPDPLHSHRRNRPLTQPPRYFSGLSAPIYAISPPAPKKRLPILFNPANRHAPARSTAGSTPRRSRQNGWFLHHQTNAEFVGVRTEDGVGRGNGKDSCLGG